MSKIIECAADELARALTNVYAFTGSDFTLPMLMHAQLRVTDGRVVIAATDRFALIRQDIAGNVLAESDGTWLIHRDDAKRLAATIKPIKRGMVTVSVDVPEHRADLTVPGGTVTVEWSGGSWSGTLGQLDYVKYDSLIPNRDDAKPINQIVLGSLNIAKLVKVRTDGRSAANFMADVSFYGEDKPVRVDIVTGTDSRWDDSRAVVLLMPARRTH